MDCLEPGRQRLPPSATHSLPWRAPTARVRQRPPSWTVKPRLHLLGMGGTSSPYTLLSHRTPHRHAEGQGCLRGPQISIGGQRDGVWRAREQRRAAQLGSARSPAIWPREPLHQTEWGQVTTEGPGDEGTSRRGGCQTEPGGWAPGPGSCRRQPEALSMGQWLHPWAAGRHSPSPSRESRGRGLLWVEGKPPPSP